MKIVHKKDIKLDRSITKKRKVGRPALQKTSVACGESIDPNTTVGLNESDVPQSQLEPMESSIQVVEPDIDMEVSEPRALHTNGAQSTSVEPVDNVRLGQTIVLQANEKILKSTNEGSEVQFQVTQRPPVLIIYQQT